MYFITELKINNTYTSRDAWLCMETYI